MVLKSGPKLKIQALPDIVYKDGKKLQIQERGELSYTVRNVDEFLWQYSVMERVIINTPMGLMEVLDGQRYEKFLDMKTCEEHFRQYECGKVGLMLPGD